MRHSRVWKAARVIALCVGFICLDANIIAANEEKARDAKLARAKSKRDEALRNAKFEKKLRKLQREIEGADVTVLLDAKTGLQSKHRIRLDEGDEITFQIINTSKECYTFNFIEVESTKTAQGQGRELKHTDEVEFSTIHIETTASYEITTSRISGKTEEECPYARAWKVGVVPTGWELGFAGSYVIDRLTNPAFALRAGTGTNAGANEIVIENKEDKWNKSAAAMVHLYNSGSFELGKNVSWAPVSFGVGVVSNDDAKYYFGSGFKFGRQAFLTAGVAVGSRDELGPGLRVGDFISDANLSLKSRTDTALFVGISFSFLNANISEKLQEPFSVASPKPKDAKVQPESSDEGSHEDEALSEAAANEPQLSVLFEAADMPYVIKAVRDRIPATGPFITEVTVTYVLKAGGVGTDADAKAIKEFLEKRFSKTTFKVIPAAINANTTPR